jgi:large subunit ribosomal protein L17
MRHRRATVRLGRTASHRRALFRNMVTSLLREEKVETTIAKAKEARRVAERVITLAKRGDLHARRRAARVVQDPAVLKKLFDDIGPRFAERPGGYTRILKTGFRAGDNAPLSILQLLPARGAAVVEAPAEEAKGAGEAKAKEPKPKGEKKGKAPKAKVESKAKEQKPKAEKKKPKKDKAPRAEQKASPKGKSKSEPKGKGKGKPKKGGDRG